MRVVGKPCSAGRPANAPHTPQNAVVTSAKIRPARRVMPDTGSLIPLRIERKRKSIRPFDFSFCFVHYFEIFRLCQDLYQAGRQETTRRGARARKPAVVPR